MYSYLGLASDILSLLRTHLFVFLNKSSGYSGETGTDLEPSKYESYKNDSVVLHHASCDGKIIITLHSYLIF